MQPAPRRSHTSGQALPLHSCTDTMASAGRKLLWSAGAALASAPRAGAGRWLHSSAVAFEVFRLEVPSLGDSVPEGIIEEQLKSPGDAVEMDEPVATIATDKVRCLCAAGCGTGAA